mgnify:CR=1 FL=1
MKVLTIHNFHRKGSASGDDQVFNSEAELLENHGINVIKYSVCNDLFDSSGILGKIRATCGMLWSFKNYRIVKKIIKEEKPDVVHIHTFFPLLSPSVLYAAKRSGKNVVATLHDTRFICPCATSLRGKKLCNECGDGKYLRMCKYACFKGSRLQSFIVALIFSYHRLRKSFYNQIDRYICLNDNQINLLVDIGFDYNKIVKKYNFVPDKYRSVSEKKHDELPKRYVVFYGRIGKEKGVSELMEIWNEISDIPLVVMGRGPLESEFSAWSKKKKNVYFLGYIQHEECLSIVENCEFVVFPSIWYEGCSMVEIETESLGKGLVATDLGFSSEAIEDGYNGYKVKLGDTKRFVYLIRKLWDDEEKCKEIGRNARNDYEKKYRPEDNFSQLLKVYESLEEKT